MDYHAHIVGHGDSGSGCSIHQGVSYNGVLQSAAKPHAYKAGGIRGCYVSWTLDIPALLKHSYMLQ